MQNSLSSDRIGIIRFYLFSDIWEHKSLIHHPKMLRKLLVNYKQMLILQLELVNRSLVWRRNIIFYRCVPKNLNELFQIQSCMKWIQSVSINHTKLSWILIPYLNMSCSFIHWCLDDVIEFYKTPVNAFLPLDELCTKPLPPNLHIEHNYKRFHPDTDTMFNGISAFPKSSTIVSGLTTRKKYAGYEAQRKWPN